MEGGTYLALGVFGLSILSRLRMCIPDRPVQDTGPVVDDHAATTCVGASQSCRKDRLQSEELSEAEMVDCCLVREICLEDGTKAAPAGRRLQQQNPRQLLSLDFEARLASRYPKGFDT